MGWVLSLLFLAGVSFLWLDQKIALLLKDLPSLLTTASVFLSYATTPLLYLLLGGFLLLFCKKRSALLSYCYTTSLVFFVTGTLKLLCARARPHLFLEKGIYGFYLGEYSKGFNSFPSSHTAMITALFVLFYLRNKISLFWIGVPISIALSRLFLQKHYLSDLLCGAVIGILCAKGILWKEKRASNSLPA